MLKKSFITTVIVALFATMGTLNAQQKYAVIIGGNMNPDDLIIPVTEQWNGGQGGSPVYGFDEFWNDAYLNWEMLVFNKEFTDANVHVLFGQNGQDFTFNGQNIRYKASYHENYEVVTDANSNLSTIEDLFVNVLAPVITEDDFLFVWVMSHGGTDANGSYFYSYDNQKVYDNRLATWLGSIAAHKKVVFLSFPKSGGFIPELEDEGVIVITAGGATEGASRADDLAPGTPPIPPVTFIENEVRYGITYNHGEINYHLTSSLTGLTPLEVSLYNVTNLSTVDVDSDNFIDINEAWNWTSTNETLGGESPVCSDQDNIKATTELTYPTLLHADISEQTDVSYRGLIGISKDVSVPGTSGLEFLDNSKIYFLNEFTELSTNNASTLVIGNHCDFIGTGELNKLTVYCHTSLSL
jgi:hypothetical protein